MIHRPNSFSILSDCDRFINIQITTYKKFIETSYK